jgi:hypothetical protein
MSFTTEQIKETESALKEKAIPQSDLDNVIAVMSKYKVTPKNSAKGIKIALRRRGNQLGVSFEMNIEEDSVRFSNFTGTPDDLSVLGKVAEKFGYGYKSV